MTTSNPTPPTTFAALWREFKGVVNAYAKWLVSISWKLFAAISFVLLIAGGMIDLPQLAFLIVLTSIVIKASFKQQIQAEEKATAATYLAEAEQLKRQLVEARMAAMQAQVEPHFLFNTLASIDHLIETDPARASLMQKSLIALLRATLPAMRETSTNTGANLGQELAIIRPYLDIQKMRMEDRLDILWDVPEGLKSAEIPSMMVLSLVENSFKHGLEPKAEGGKLVLRAEVVHGKLLITVNPEQPSGFGLKNIRDRLSLFYGDQATFSIRALESFEGSGTLAQISVPYKVQPFDITQSV